MSTITAICPKCQTQYQLQPEQLQVANGKVRCGQCFTVFEPRASAPASKPASSNDVRSAYVKDEEDFITNTNKSNFQSHNEFDDFFGHSESLLDDESWVKDLLNEDEEQPQQEDESWVESLLADEDEELVEEETTDDLADFDVNLQLSDEEELALAALSEKGSLRSRIQLEPLEFALAGRRQLWLKLLMLLLIVALGLSLVAQLLYFQFDQLSKQSQWRPAYVQLCQWLKCELPDEYSIADIRATQLTVRSSKDNPHALSVDMVMLSQAKTAQPFPLFELFFTDRNEQIVAARSFTPEEYLLGELKEVDLMPKNQPIHINLEIKDPGSNASGYKMQLRYP